MLLMSNTIKKKRKKGNKPQASALCIFLIMSISRNFTRRRGGAGDAEKCRNIGYYKHHADTLGSQSLQITLPLS